ncbi:hypothetical protein [Salinarimonas soli]|uniref:Uncharacterized protein n=1 Tax=Salinarimonas soli TaxID=1638099 RepID=A0A5B2V897_9HYPH|nr:hypothetical protein [Salinarimonas soli]KAA2234795.1 hypothetical protein F0L46_22870 [Salinarimonas soli]
MGPRPAAFRRAILVAAIGATLAAAHVNFASSAPAARATPPAHPVDAELVGENCYYDVQTVTNKAGQSVAARVVECD